MSEVHSSIRLSEALEEAGLRRLAVRARAHEFHDFLSPHPLPATALAEELAEFGTGAEAFIARVREGEFDASKEEADQWAASPEGQAIMKNLGASSRTPESGLVDENHSLLVGHVVGALMRLAADAGAPTEVEPITVGPRVYSNRIRVVRPSGSYIVTVIKEAL